MIQDSKIAISNRLSDNNKVPQIWGLNAEQLHDAYWRTHGIQCIRRGAKQQLQPGVDLFLLVEPEQLVLFDLSLLIDRLAWRRAAVTRLRVVTLEEDRYAEKVDIDESNMVRRIERRYRANTHAAYRVLLTRKRRIAEKWMMSELRRDGWRKIRAMVGQSNIDSHRIAGQCYISHDTNDENKLINNLVKIWRYPNAAIAGIKELGASVWAHQSIEIPSQVTVVGPAWIGKIAQLDEEECLIGPIWVCDAEIETNGQAQTVSVRNIYDIEPPEGPKDEVSKTPKASNNCSAGYLFTKRTIDIVVSGIGLVFMLPLICIISIWIIVDNGWPILYGDVRQTRGGRDFKCWKFRTMCRNASKIKLDLEKLNACDGPQFYMENDPRVTRVGKFLRLCHLDELPQLWNVLVGDMSLVGPRPSPDKENQYCPSWRDIRLSMRPGMTGLWQLNRTRSPGLDFQEWIRFDTEYVEKCNTYFDMKILILTVLGVITKGIKSAFNFSR